MEGENCIKNNYISILTPWIYTPSRRTSLHVKEMVVEVVISVSLEDEVME
jgi:hypothetical protein